MHVFFMKELITEVTLIFFIFRALISDKSEFVSKTNKKDTRPMFEPSPCI